MDHPFLYDKAKYHLESIEKLGLPEIHAYIHTGLFVGWLVKNSMLSDWFAEECSDEINDFLSKQITAPELFRLWDGALVDDMLSDDGNKFAQSYFEFETGRYLKDYSRHVSSGLQSEFHVEDSWDNFEKASKMIDRRYGEWKGSGTRKWWQFWK